jgi:hypothetical protein
VEINCKDGTCTRELRIKNTEKMHETTKTNQKKANKRAAAWGEYDLTLQDSPSERT